MNASARRARGMAAVQSWPVLSKPAISHRWRPRLEIGIVEHDHRGLAAELEMDPLEVVGGGARITSLPVATSR